MAWTTEDIPDLSGRVAVVTGANGGLGLEVSRELARKGAFVVMASPDIGFGIGVDSDVEAATTPSEPRARVDGSRWCASPRENARLMDLLGTSINAAVVAVVGALLAWLARGRFDALDRRIDRLETQLVGTETRLDGRIDRMESRIDGVESRLGSRIDGLESRFDGLESRFDGRFDALQSSMDAMRSDLTQVALAVGVRPRAQND